MPICWTNSLKCVRSPEIFNLCHSSYNWTNYPEQNIQSKLNIHECQIDDGILRMRRGNKLVMLTGEPRVGSGEPPIHRSLQRTKAAPEPLLPSLEIAISRLEEHVIPLIPPLGAATHRLPPGNRSRRSRDAVHGRGAGEVGRGGEPAAANGSRPTNCSTTAANPRNPAPPPPPPTARSRKGKEMATGCRASGVRWARGWVNGSSVGVGAGGSVGWLGPGWLVGWTGLDARV